MNIRLQQVTARLLNSKGIAFTAAILTGRVMTGTYLLSFHRLEELRIGLGVLQFGEQELDRCEFIHRMQDFS